MDPDNTEDIIKILKKVNELGTTVILTTHNKDVINSLGRKRVITMEGGEVVRDGNGGYVL